MATINFLYRSVRPEAFLILRLLYRTDEKDFQIDGKTKIQVSKTYWKNTHFKRRINEPDLSNFRNEINTKLDHLRKFVLENFHRKNPTEIDKEWLKSTLKAYYNPQIENTIPTKLLDFFEFYLVQKANDLSHSRKKKINVVKHKIERFEKHSNKSLILNDIDEDFKNDFIEYSDDQKYARNTQNGDLAVIKTICYYARRKGMKTHMELDSLRIKEEPTAAIYLTPEEIEKIEKMELNSDRLDNARDWLLISCYTGQRISDFMKFNAGIIRTDDNKYFLDFKQEKTGKLMSIPFVKKARAIIKKRDGQFPRAISHTRYNEYVKEVCKLAEITEEVEGKIRESITIEANKAKSKNYRDVIGRHEKWKLVSSHIGRRSFATNNYGNIPTTYLIYITGHSTEKMFLKYIRKSNKDLAKDAYKYFE